MVEEKKVEETKVEEDSFEDDFELGEWEGAEEAKEEKPNPEPPAGEVKSEREKALEEELRQAKLQVARNERKEKVRKTLEDIKEKFPHANLERLQNLAKKGASAETIFDKAREQDYAVKTHLKKSKAEEATKAAEATAEKEKELEAAYGVVHGSGEGAPSNITDALTGAKSEKEVLEIIKKSGMK